MVTADPADSGVVFTPLPDTTTLQRLAATGPTVQQATATQRASVEQQHAARAAFLPQLDANYSFTGNGQNAYLGLGDPYTYGNRFSLSLSLPILDQFQREAALERAQIAASNAGASTRDARLAARQVSPRRSARSSLRATASPSRPRRFVPRKKIFACSSTAIACTRPRSSTC